MTSEDPALTRAKAHLLQSPGGYLTAGPPGASRVVDLPLSASPLQASTLLVSNLLYPEHEGNRLNSERAIGVEILKRRSKGPPSFSGGIKPRRDFGPSETQEISRTAGALKTLMGAPRPPTYRSSTTLSPPVGR